MPFRQLPAHPHLDHLKGQARALRRAFDAGEAQAVARVRAVLGAQETLKLTEAQRVVAREYGFPSWARLRAHVQAARGVAEAVAAFLDALDEQDAARAGEVLRAEPRAATASLHVAAALGLEEEVRRQLREHPEQVRVRAGRSPSEPLLWLCASPFHGGSPARDRGLVASARALLEAGADPDTRSGGAFELPALYFVTGVREATAVARLLLEAGANPDDGESAHHAAQMGHLRALELLREFGADLDYDAAAYTPLTFVLESSAPASASAAQGVRWLLEHGADPNLASGPSGETALHIATRRGFDPEMLRLLLAHGADPASRRADGRTPWTLARRGGFDPLAAVLEAAGAEPQPIGPEDALLAACARGEVTAAAALATPALVRALSPDALALLPRAAGEGWPKVVHACLAAGWPVDAVDEFGATALHQACLQGRSGVVRELLARGADLARRDPEHNGTALGWACFGADYVHASDGDYESCVRALLEAGARHGPDQHYPDDAALRSLLASGPS